MPKAFVVGEIEVNDPETYSTYTAQTPAAIAKYGGKFVARGGTVEVLEGASPKGRVVVIEFPDLESAKKWYASEDYQPLIPIRQSASEGRFFLVEGCD
ncbi:MAG: DUF1330 domain-containing protein [Planctomycetota bacterium]